MAETGTLVRAPESDARPALRNKSLRRALLIGGPLAVVVAATGLWLGGGHSVSTDNAYLQADKMVVAARLAGTVAEVPVVDNQRVRAGDMLFRLDDQPFRMAADAARANLAQAEVDLTALAATWRQRMADIQEAESDVDYYQRQFARQETLAGRGVASEAALDSARRSLAGARAHVSSLKQEAQAVLAQLGGDAARAVQLHPRWLAAKAALDKAEYDLGQTVTRAPMDGIVANVDKVQPGEVMAAGTAAFTLVGARPWVEANPKETDLTHVQPGDHAIVTVDTYPGREWQAHVASISPATGAEFSVLPAQNSSGNWVKVVQRVPVRLELDIPADAPPLAAGMSVEVTIDTNHHRSFKDLFGGLLG